MVKKLGIVGSGAVVQNQYAKVLSMYHDIKVDGIFDINEKSSLEVAKIFGAEAISKGELLERSDIIVIATPPSTHYDLVIESIKPGRKIICEKPFVGSVSECLDLISKAKEGKSELFVAHFRRCLPSVLLAKSIVKSGVLGEIIGIEAYEGGRFSWQTQSGYVYKDPYGGVLFDTGSHTIDMALFIAGLDEKQIETKIISIKKDKEEPAHDIRAELNLFSNNFDISFKVKLSRKILLANKIRITGTNGFIDVPVGLANYIRLGGAFDSTVIYTNQQYGDLMDCFAMQFKEMFYDVENSSFQADKFLSLTKVLETIAKN